MSDEYPKGVGWWADRFGRRPVRTSFQLFLGIAGFVIAVMVVLWLTNVVAAPWKAAGDISQQKNSAPNQIAQQGQFSDDKAAFEASQEQITGAQMALDQVTILATINGPVDPVTAYQNAQQVTELRGVLSGSIAHCQNLAADYDSLATKYLSSDLQGAGLPDTLNSSECQAVASSQLQIDKNTAASQGAPGTRPTG